MVSLMKVDSLQNTVGTSAVNVDKLSAGGYYIKQYDVEVNSASYSATTSWGLGITFTGMTNCQPGSKIFMSYLIPARNDSTSWGGLYIEPQISINSGAWQSLGSCGYDGGVMHNGSSDIASYTNCILIDPAQTSVFTFAVRFYFKSYDGTTVINASNDINGISGTATLMSGVNGTQHYAKIILQELATLT